MNKEQLKEALMEYSEKHDIDLKKSWYNLSEENMQKYYDELMVGTKPASTDTVQTDAGEIQTDVVAQEAPVVAVSGSIPKTETNPFGEVIVEVMIPIDKQNPKKKLMWISVNCKPLYFPIGKVAKMPMAYYLVYQNNVAADVLVSQKMQALAMTEI